MVWWVCAKWDLLPVGGMMAGWFLCSRGERPSFYIERWGIFSGVNSNWGIYAGGSLNHVFWLVRIWMLKHVSWLVRAESCILIGQNMMTEICWTEPWVVIGQNLMTETKWAEPWVVIGQNLRTENCELNHELWLVRTWWVNPASWLVTTSWLKAESWLVDTNYVLINY